MIKKILYVGPYALKGHALLAPMSGITDPPFRSLCASYGAALTPSEMVTSDVELWQSNKSSKRLVLDNNPTIPNTVQIVGYCPQQMARAAVLLESSGVDIVDINMGCPARKVCNRLAGSALMQDEKLVYAILKAVVSAVSIPITLKIRTGWNLANKNVVRIAKMAEDIGVVSLVIHGRTRECRFKGTVDYETIGSVKKAVSIPVFANGDICSAEQSKQIINEFGVDGVMIGRGAQGKPWLFKQINDYLENGVLTEEPSPTEKQAVVMCHVRALHDFYGEYQGVRIARKHVGWYCTVEKRDALVMKLFNQIKFASEQLAFIQSHF